MKNGIFALVIIGLGIGCVKVPGKSDRVFLLTSPSYENQLGEDGYKEVLSQSKISKDPKYNEILKRVGRRIAQQTHATGFKWEFNLIESKEQNAFCMPGGKVAVYTGILPMMKNEAGMAVVIGHEAAHAVLRHSGERISQQMMAGLGLSLAEIGFGNRKHKNLLLGALGAGATVAFILPFSRKHEYEADATGLEYMAKAGYDPQEAVNFWQRFSRGEQSTGFVWLSTHPPSKDRVVELKKATRRLRSTYARLPNKFGQGESF